MYAESGYDVAVVAHLSQCEQCCEIQLIDVIVDGSQQCCHVVFGCTSYFLKISMTVWEFRAYHWKAFLAIFFKKR